MANALTALLTKSTLTRTDSDYERMLDDFVRFAGGVRLADQFLIPRGAQNADYFFDLEEVEIVVELKQLRAYRPAKTVDQYFSERLGEGKVKRFEELSNGRIRITPESLSASDWHRFYKCFCPTVSGDLNKAARQLKDTEGFLPAARGRRLKGVILLNSGNFNLPTDLLIRLVEWKLKREWRGGHFRSIDFASCVTVDMFRDGQNPLHTRHIARSGTDEVLVSGVHYLWDRWIHYGAAAMGGEIVPDAPLGEQAPPDLSQPFRGKIAFVPSGR